MADIFDWSSTASQNTTVDGIDVDTDMPIGGIDNAFRSTMAIIRNSFASGLKSFLSGLSALGVDRGGTGATTLTGLLKGNGASAITAIAMDGTTKKFLRADSSFNAPVESIAMKITDDATSPLAGTGKFYFRVPYAFAVDDVRASLNSAQTGGSLLTVDINKNGSSILSTKLTIDNNETTSKTAVTAPVISGGTFADDDILSVDIDQAGTGGKGLTVTILGRQV
jgi:hypothetical protein